MTEKQIERVRVKITRVKRALADDKKRWGGYYEDGALDDVERGWQARQVLGYSAAEKDWADFATWVEALLSAEPFLHFSTVYLDVQQRIKEEPDITKRNLLREERCAMLEGVGLIYG